MSEESDLSGRVQELEKELTELRLHCRAQELMATFALAVAKKQQARIGELEAKLLATGRQPLVVEERESYAMDS